MLNKGNAFLEVSNLKNETVLVALENILFLRIENGFVHVYLHKKRDSIIAQNALSKLEKQLDDSAFFRVHRNCIVNLKRVENYGTYPGKVISIESFEIVLAKRRRLEFHNAFMNYKKR